MKSLVKHRGNPLEVFAARGKVCAPIAIQKNFHEALIIAGHALMLINAKFSMVMIFLPISNSIKYG